MHRTGATGVEPRLITEHQRAVERFYSVIITTENLRMRCSLRVGLSNPFTKPSRYRSVKLDRTFMNFEELHELVPFARFGKAKSLTMQPYNGVTLAMPGRHAEDTTPKGGDFVVMVDDDELNWTKHQFTHTDIFKDIEKKFKYDDLSLNDDFIKAYYNVVVNGADPNDYKYKRGDVPGLHRQTFLYAVQCLAVAEHRRYAVHEPKGGGRYLPLRFVLGIAAGKWTAEEAAEKQKFGRPSVERLERTKGRPK